MLTNFHGIGNFRNAICRISGTERICFAIKGVVFSLGVFRRMNLRRRPSEAWQDYSCDVRIHSGILPRHYELKSDNVTAVYQG